MGQKIKEIRIKGFRGIKSELTLSLDEKSALFYGDNGTGKSSIADAIEWFYTDEVEHLSGGEIDKHALRNFDLKEDEDATVSVDLSSNDLKSNKSLSVKKGRIAAQFSNQEEAFSGYYENSEKENILLRYRNLEDFVTATKSEKLVRLSDIIGFGEVTKVRGVIQKSFNALKSEIKSQGFESQLQAQQTVLLEKLGTNIFTPEQLFKELNNLISPLKLGVQINSLKDIDAAIEKIKSPIDKKTISELAFLQKCNEVLNILSGELSTIDAEYQSFFDEYKKVFDNVETIKQTLLKEFLEEGQKILLHKSYSEGKCPLCLKDETTESLLTNITKRLKEIEISSEKLKELDKARGLIKLTVETRSSRLHNLLFDPLMSEEKHAQVKSSVTKLKSKLDDYLPEIKAKVLSGSMVKKASELKIQISDFLLNPSLQEQITVINDKISKDTSSDIRVKIEFAKNAFSKKLELDFAKKALETQKDSLALIYNEFVKKQKEALEAFLSTFSARINEYYQFMNPDESFEDLKIIMIEEDDELKGITIEFKFNGKPASPPQKYFSESHINCYGLAFFLASVVAFNKTNKFIIFDDVISSFDSNHRKRFADLLFEKFSDYQLILLTHETEWFTYISELAKRKSWIIKEIKWNNDQGTHLEAAPSELREKIEQEIANNDESQLGNSIRIYLEQDLKRICHSVEVKTNFRFNDQNEKRMADELFSELKSTINKKSSELKAKMPTIERIANSTVLANLLSHDNKLNPKMGDLRALWKDILDLEGIFFCHEKNCGRELSMKYFDNVENRIRCGCGKLSYNWK